MVMLIIGGVQNLSKRIRIRKFLQAQCHAQTDGSPRSVAMYMHTLILVSAISVSCNG